VIPNTSFYVSKQLRGFLEFGLAGSIKSSMLRVVGRTETTPIANLLKRSFFENLW